MLPSIVEENKENYKNYMSNIWINHSDIKDIDLMMQAFFHKSFVADFPYNFNDNERLEFLWDSVLWFVISKFLFDYWKDVPESKLTLYKIALVREENLAEVARDIHLDKMVFLWYWEEKTLWRKKDSILSDTLEALLGYIYLDLWIEAVENFIKNYIFIKIEKIKLLSVKSNKTLVQEYSQKHYKEVPLYKDHDYEIDDKGNVLSYKSDLYINDEHVWVWYWSNKKTAQELAAKDACNRLNISTKNNY